MEAAPVRGSRSGARGAVVAAVQDVKKDVCLLRQHYALADLCDLQRAI